MAIVVVCDVCGRVLNPYHERNGDIKVPNHYQGGRRTKRECPGSRSAPSKARPSGQRHVVVSWDRRQQPDWDEVRSAIYDLTGQWLHWGMAETGANLDRYGLVLSAWPMCEQKDVDSAYQEWLHRGENADAT